jgi:hypothetical protein
MVTSLDHLSGHRSIHSDVLARLKGTFMQLMGSALHVFSDFSWSEMVSAPLSVNSLSLAIHQPCFNLF